MERYCKRCNCVLPHIKAGHACGKQLYQCKGCGKRHTKPEHRTDKRCKRPTTTVAVRLTEEDLARLDVLPGDTHSARIRAAIDMAAKQPPYTGEIK